MSVPVFLNSSHRYIRSNGITDVADIITLLRDELLNQNSPVWTEPSTALFQSPVDAVGRWFDCLFTRVDADSLQMRVRDKNGVTVCTRNMDIVAAGTDIQIMSGQMHLYINSLRAITEALVAGLYDLTPEAQDAHSGYTFGNGSRNSSGSTDGYTSYSVHYNWSFWLAEQDYKPRSALEYILVPGETINTIRETGAYAFRPSYAYARNYAGDTRQQGRLYQAYLGSYSLQVGTLYDVPIDVGVTAKFTRVCLPASGYTCLFVRAD